MGRGLWRRQESLDKTIQVLELKMKSLAVRIAKTVFKCRGSTPVYKGWHIRGTSIGNSSSCAKVLSIRLDLIEERDQQ